MCELQQRGTASRSWVAGRYSNQEASVQAFDLMVADRYAEDGVASQRAVRERYNTPPPKPDHERRERPPHDGRRAAQRGRRRQPDGLTRAQIPVAPLRWSPRSAPSRQAMKIRIAVTDTMIVEIALISGVTPNRIFE